MDDALAAHEAGQQTPLGRRCRACPQVLHGFDKTRPPMGRGKAEVFSCADHQDAVCCAAEGMSLFQYSVENRCEITGRGIDDLQYLGGRRLLVQHLVALGRALIQLPKRFVPLGSALGEIALKLGIDLLRIG